MKKLSLTIFLVAVLFLSYNAYAAGLSGSFTGSNHPTVSVGGNCPPINVKMNVTGVCEGANSINYGCGPATTVTGIYGKFLRHDANVSAKGTCSVGNCTAWLNDTVSTVCLNSTGTLLNNVYLNANCSKSITTESITILGGYNTSCTAGGCDTFKCNITTYYAPCTKDPQAAVSGTVWKYTGLLSDTSAVITIGTNSNPSLKTVPGNLQPGSNLLSLSAINLNKFNYVINWTEETVTGGSDKDGDGYYDSQCTLGNDCNDNDPNVYPGHVEVPDNRKDDNCDGIGDTLTINSMDDITAKCTYYSGTRTYDCTGWENIGITADITLPVADCWYDRRCGDNGQVLGCNPNNIIFKANNEFSANNFYISSAGGRAGSITIEAKRITASTLQAAGTTCSSSSCSCSPPYCSNSDGGNITLKADTVSVGTINANHGGGVYSGNVGSAGKVTITANTTTVTNIYSNGGYYGGCYGGGGNGGTVVIKSNTSSINSISTNGGEGTNAGYGANGGAAGNAKIAANNLNVGTISANGGGPDQKKGAGGNVKVYTDIYSLSGISASGPNGFIGFFTDSAYPSGLSANQIKLANRTGSGFFVLETNLTDPQYKTYHLEIKDTSTGEKAKDAGGYDYLQQGRINNKYLTAAIGWVTKLKLKLGKDYALAIVASNESFFNMSRCGLDALCRNITIPFVKY